MENMKLMEYEPISMLVVDNRAVPKPKFAVFDIHTHLSGVNPEKGPGNIAKFVEMMGEYGVTRVVDLDGFYGKALENSLRAKEGFEDKVYTFCTVDLNTVEDADFEQKTRAALIKAHGMGVRGLKFLKSVGLGYKTKDGKYLRPDDERLQVIWQTAAELKLPVLIHIADPKAFFTPLDVRNERIEELAGNPSWAFTDPKYYRFDELMQMQERMLCNNENTHFILAHVGNCAEDLGYVSGILDRHENVSVDLAARIAELGRQPYTARKFLMTYQDRVLFGTDDMYSPTKKENPLLNNQMYYEFLETYNEYFVANAFEQQGRWNIYGVGLPDEVLKKIYMGNACRAIGIAE